MRYSKPLTALFFAAPLLGNGIWFLLTVSRAHIFHQTGLAFCHVVAIFCGLASLVTLTGFLIRELPLSWAVLGSGLQAFLLIFIFAGFYRDIGLLGGEPHEITDFASGLYFSVVTWTTLGYGDLHPSVPIRLIAAEEALLGYINSGILVGVLVSQFDKLRSLSAHKR